MPLIINFPADGGPPIVTDTRTLNDAKADALLRVQSALDSAVASGYTDPTLSVTLLIDRDGRADLGSYRDHLTDKGVPEAATIPFFDITGAMRAATFGDYKALLIRAGDYYLGLRLKLGQLQAAINAAQTVADADVIVW